MASFNIEMHRKGPGLMLRDILRGDAQAQAVAQVVARVAPDILLLQGVDYDADLHGVRALRDVMAAAGIAYPHVFALRPNSGMATGFDMNGDGRLGEAADKQGFGFFAGQRGMALLSRWPIEEAAVQDFSGLLWRDLPGAELPFVKGAPFPSKDAQAVQRLSSVGHWIVPVKAPGGILSVLAFCATPPVFDGPEDRNGLRNADEIRLWTQVLDGFLGTAPKQRFLLVGTANLDPEKGEGRHEVIRALLSHPKIQDVTPGSAEGGADTVDWTDPVPGDMRVDYVLPSADWRIVDAGVFWPAPGDADHEVTALASRHRLVWVDVVSRTAEGF